MAEWRDNHLLRAMADADVAAIRPALTPVVLAKHEELVMAGTRVRYAWFPLSGIVSTVAATAGGARAEVAIVGREGMVSMATLHGVEIEPMTVFMQIGGTALRLPATALLTALAQRPSLHRHLLAYAHGFLVQVARSALAYATQTIEARLARWLLMSLDRLDSDEVAMTHEAFAMMLGVRRAGVTVALQGLEAKGAIVGRRAAVEVIDRAVLAGIAGDAYGPADRGMPRAAGHRGGGAAAAIGEPDSPR